MTTFIIKDIFKTYVIIDNLYEYVTRMQSTILIIDQNTLPNFKKNEVLIRIRSKNAKRLTQLLLLLLQIPL